MKEQKVNANIFDFVCESESIENYSLNKSTIESNSESLMKNINKDVIMAFLNCPDTKLQIVKSNNQQEMYQLLAMNTISNETVKIKGLGDHFKTFVNVIATAQQVYKKRQNQDYSTPLLDSKFIKDINLGIQPYREGEIAIGEYRTVDFLGRPVEVHISANDSKPLRCFQIETSKDNNVVNKMDSLIYWTNNNAFKNQTKIMEDVAIFHANFIKIHPFRDGNGRTARLLSNYLLVANGKDIINLPEESREDYFKAIDYAMADSTKDFLNESPDYQKFYDDAYSKYGERTDENKFRPLIDLFENFSTEDTNQIISGIIDYKDKVNDRTFYADQIPTEEAPEA